MDVSKLIEHPDFAYWQKLVSDHRDELEAALTAERERADKAEAEARRIAAERNEYAKSKEFWLNEEAVRRAERDDLTRKLAETEAAWRNESRAATLWTARAIAAERQLAEAVEVVQGMLKLQLIDDDDADEDLIPEWQRARAFIQKQEADRG